RAEPGPAGDTGEAGAVHHLDRAVADTAPLSATATAKREFGVHAPGVAPVHTTAGHALDADGTPESSLGTRLTHICLPVVRPRRAERIPSAIATVCALPRTMCELGSAPGDESPHCCASDLPP